MLQRASRYRAFSRTSRLAALAAVSFATLLAWALSPALFRAASRPAPSHADSLPDAAAPAPRKTTLKLAFPAVVAPEDLVDALEALDEFGEPIEATAAPAPSDPKSIMATLDRWPATARVRAGLRAKDGSWVLRRDLEFAEAQLVVAPESMPSDAWGRVALPPPFFRGARVAKVAAKEQRIALEFARPVAASDLAAALAIEDSKSGEAVPFAIATEGAATRHEARIALADPMAATLAIALGAGLADADGRLLDEEARAEVAWDTPPLEVESAFVDRYNGKAGAVLRLRFNRLLEPAAAQASLRLDPPVENLRVERGYWGSEWLNVSGDFASNTSYRLGVDDELVDADGLPARPISNPIRFFDVEEIPSWIGFADAGKFYLPRQGKRELAIESRNADGATARVSRVFPSNVAAMLVDLNDGDPSWSFDDRWSEALGERPLPLSPVRDKLAESRVSLGALLGDESAKGLFHVELIGGGARASTLALATELGLLAQWTGDQAWVFVHDLKTLEPKAGATVSLYSKKNQPLGAATTDERGVAWFEGLATASLGEPAVAVAELGDDYAFLELAPERGDALVVGAGMPSRDGGAAEAYLFADRELYRPGDAIHLRWIARENYGGEPAADLPALLQAFKPNGQLLASHLSTLSEVGTGGFDIETGRDFPTGRYVARLSVPGGKTLGELAVSVEDFAPRRVEASIEVDRPGAWLANESRGLKIAARHPFGAPADGRLASLVVVPSGAEFRSAAWPGFRFSNDDPFELRPIALGDATTDGDGVARFALEGSRLPVGATKPLPLSLRGEVFELGGGSARASESASFFPAETALGVALGEADGDEIAVEIAAIASDESPASIARAEAILYRAEWRYNARRFRSHDEPSWTRDYVVVDRQPVALSNGRGAARFDRGHGWGEWRVEARSDETPMKASLDFDSWGGAPEATAGRPSLARLEVRGEGRRAGDRVEIALRSPADGRAVVALQGERLHEVATTEIKDGVGVVAFTLKPEHFPNAWVEATVVHAPLGAAAGLHPYSSFAAASIHLDDPARRLGMTFVGIPEEAAPGQALEIVVDARDGLGAPAAGAEIVLAAVDEGIHAVTGFRSGDPASWLGRERRPDHRRAHYYDRVSLDFGEPLAGGDGAAEDPLSPRLDATGESWLRPVALWAGAVVADGAGRAVFSIEPPAGFNGRLRLVATAASSSATGSSTAELFVREPLMLRTNQPRFLLPGDAFESTASLFNQTDEPARVRVAWSAEGSLDAEAGERVLELAPRGEAVVAGRFLAREVGQGAATWRVEKLDGEGASIESFDRVVPIPVRSPAARRSHREVAIVAPGETRAFANAMFLPEQRAKSTVSAGASPMLGLERALADLADYPYGCVEQTTSRLLPLVALSTVATPEGAEKDPRLSPERLAHYIDSGVARLFSMQTPSGGLAYWPDGSAAHPFGSVYALHCLALAEKAANRPLPAENMEALTRYARSVATGSASDAESAFTQAYAIFALSVAGERGLAMEIDRLDRADLSDPARCLLAAAMARDARDATRASAFLASASASPLAPNPAGPVFSSNIRDAAIRLSTLCALGEAAKAETKRELAERLSRWLERERGNTHELALVATALADYLRDAPPTGECAWTLVDASGNAESFAGGETRKRSWSGAAAFSIRNDGDAPLYASFEASGSPRVANEPAESRGLAVSRRFLRRDGSERDDAEFAPGESAIVEIRVACVDKVERVVVDDPLPAGFELEHPRLDASTALAVGLSDPATPSRLEIRDDRIVLAFDALPQGEHVFRYVVQASTRGDFAHPGVVGECMYDASIRGRSEAGSVSIR